MKTCFDFQFDCGWIFALKTAKIGGRWKLFFFPFLAKSKKLLIWAGKHLTTTVNFDEQEAIRNAKKPDDYWLFWTPVNMYDNCSIVLLSTNWGFDSPWERAFFAAMIVKAHCCFFFFSVLVSTEKTLKRRYWAPKFLNGHQCNNSILAPNGDNYSVG